MKRSRLFGYHTRHDAHERAQNQARGNGKGTGAFLKLFVLLLAFCVWAAGMPATAFAEETGQKVVRVGYFQDNDGFQNGFADNAPKSGYAYEYFQEVAKYTGWKYEYVYGSWSDVYQKLVNGEVDIMGGVSKLDNRLPDMLFPDNIMGVESYYVFVPSASTAIRATDPSSLNGKRIGVNDNTNMLDLLKQYVAANAPDCQVIAYSGTEERMAALDKGELDGVVTVDNYTIDGLKPVLKIGASDYYCAVNKARPDILAELNAAQEKILSDSPYYISSLQRKYFNTSVTRESLTDAETAWLGEHSALRLGYLKNCLPYCGDDSLTGEPSGMLAAIRPDLEEFMGITMTTVGYDDLNALSTALKDGEIDMAFPASGDIWIAENQDYIQSRSMTNDRIAVVYTGEFTDSVYDRIAIAGDSSVQPLYVNVKYPNAKQISCTDVGDCLDAVEKGRASSCLVSSNVLYRYFGEKGQNDKLHVAYSEDTMDYCFAVSRSSTTLYTILNKAITSVDETKINNAVIQSANAEAPYSFSSFLEHNVNGVVVFLVILFTMLTMVFVTYRRKTVKNQKELQEAYEAANKAAEAKTVFLSTMSHDIRTPMNAIINLTGIAKEEIDDREKLAEDLDKIDISNKFLLGLINDILDISKIESGELVLNETVYSYEKFRRYIQSVIVPLCDSKDIRFEMVECTGIRNIYTDEVRFNQIFFNLLSNAVKYSEPGSVVSFRIENLRCEGQQLAVDFIVEDHGAGMSEEFQQKLFMPFEREFGGDARMGTGLGLAITKRIVDAMGGTITVDSQQGRGTAITVHLDLKIADDEEAAPLPAELSVDAAAILQGRRILVVEDHPLNREIITRILEAGGLTVESAGNGAEALAAFEKSETGHYDVILMDIRMPVMNGLEAAKAIRALPRADAATVPIIATTAEAFEQEKKEVFSAGMNGHLAKPIDTEQMFATLARALESGGALAE
jgi:signal transduction histidine kinase/ABC-type amino acid transport substrate-binding protein/ActR/RegA family two-component response regulator